MSIESLLVEKGAILLERERLEARLLLLMQILKNSELNRAHFHLSEEIKRKYEIEVEKIMSQLGITDSPTLPERMKRVEKRLRAVDQERQRRDQQERDAGVQVPHRPDTIYWYPNPHKRLTKKR